MNTTREHNQSVKDESAWLVVQCRCGHKTERKMQHYDKARCICGLWYRAIRPKAGDPLTVVPHVEDWPRDTDRNLISATVQELFNKDHINVTYAESGKVIADLHNAGRRLLTFTHLANGKGYRLGVSPAA